MLINVFKENTMIVNSMNTKVRKKVSLILGAASLVLLAQTSVQGAEDPIKGLPGDAGKIERKHRAVTVTPKTAEKLKEARADAYEHGDVEQKHIDAFKAELAKIDKILDPKEKAFYDTTDLLADLSYVAIIQDIPVSGAFNELYTEMQVIGHELGFSDKKQQKVRTAVHKVITDYLDGFLANNKATDAELVETAWVELAKQVKAKEDKIFTKQEEAAKVEAERVLKEKEAEAAKRKVEKEEAARQLAEKKNQERIKKQKLMQRQLKVQQAEAERRMALTGQMTASKITHPETGKIVGEKK